MQVKQDDQMTPAYYQAGVNGNAFSQTKNAERFPSVAMQDAAVSHLVSLPSLAYQASTPSTKQLLSTCL